MKYKYQLFEKALLLEQELDRLKSEKAAKKVAGIMDELWVNGWREEYDLWAQNIRE